MKRIGLSLLLFFGLVCSALAQTPQLVRPCVGTAANCNPVSSASPMPVTPTSSQAVALVDRSGTITSGGTAQQLMAANASRRGCIIQNVSAGDLWFSSLATAVQNQPSIWLPAGSYWECPDNGVPGGAISIIGATTGQAIAAREW